MTYLKSSTSEAQPKLHQTGKVIQEFDDLMAVDIGLTRSTRSESVTLLNQVLADSIMLRDLYKKHHWQVTGPTFNQLHLLFDKHFDEQVLLVDATAERIQSLGGLSVAVPQDVAELTKVARPPKGREEAPAQLSRLLDAHKIILVEAHESAKTASSAGDDGTNDLLVSQIIRTNEAQVWFLSQHLAATPLAEVSR